VFVWYKAHQCRLFGRREKDNMKTSYQGFIRLCCVFLHDQLDKGLNANPDNRFWREAYEREVMPIHAVQDYIENVLCMTFKEYSSNGNVKG
jgi:hypothetical protein